MSEEITELHALCPVQSRISVPVLVLLLQHDFHGSCIPVPVPV